MALVARMDEYGKGAWFALTIAAFWLAWPIGLAILAFLAGSGRLRTWRAEMSGAPGRWFNLRPASPGSTPWSTPWSTFTHGFNQGSTGSGNAAFDAYRQAELDRLEQEAKEFRDYLERLRSARDKAEFDRFMAERRTSRNDTTTITPNGETA